MIYTLTLNPSIDYIMFTENFNLGGLNRATETYKFAGGKGINVSRVLKAHEVDNTALGFIGGFPGKFIDDALNEAGIDTKFIEVSQDTRINVKLKGHTETEINAGGPVISESNYSALLEQIKKLKQEDILVISGSIPQSMTPNVYKEIAQICSENKVKFVVDAEKSLLTSTFDYRPELIKPNQTELEEMFDTKLNNKQEIIEIAKSLKEKGPKVVMVSLGGDGALLVSDEGIYEAVVPKGTVVNTVGSGDSTVAGYIAGLSKGLSIKNSFKLATASGTATAFTEDLASIEQIRNIEPQIQINQLEGGLQ